MEKSNLFTEKMHKIAKAITTAKNDLEIKTILTPFGYDDAELDKTMDLYNVVHEHSSEKELLKISNKNLSSEVSELHEKVHGLFKDAVGIAKIVFKNDVAVKSTLKLTDSIKRKTAVLIESSKHFYLTLLSDDTLIEKMSNRSYTKAKLEGELSVVKEFEKKNNELSIDDVDSTSATEKKHEQFEILEDWYSDFKAVAKIALKEHPKLLKKLGFDWKFTKL